MSPRPILFTPGPLTTSASVKAAMLEDYGSRDGEFVHVVAEIRSELLRIAGVSQDQGYGCVLMQGAGSFGIEAVLSSALAQDDRLLVLVNGAYGRRICQMAERHGISLRVEELGDTRPAEPQRVARLLAEEPSISHVAVVHCETTTGLLNPVEAIGGVVNGAGRSLIVDGMSSFGGLPTDLRTLQADFLVSSANKCLQGVPGFSLVLARRKALEACEGQARTLSLDLWAQWQGLERNGQFRFTPPTHSLLAFRQALRELEEEGGVEARHARYRGLHQQLVEGMEGLGYRPVLDPRVQAPIICAFHFPSPEFEFGAFYDALLERGHAIYPGKLSSIPCFRIGNIGHIDAGDVEALLQAVATLTTELHPCRP